MKVLKVNGSVLSELRIKKGFSLNKLATETGIHHATLSRIENEKCNARPKTAAKIVEKLNADFDQLFEIVDA